IGVCHKRPCSRRSRGRCGALKINEMSGPTWPGSGDQGMTLCAELDSREGALRFNDDIADEMVAKAREIAKSIKRDLQQSEVDRRMSDENFKALEDAGLLDLVCPVRDGGYGASFTTFTRCVLEISRVSGSAGWLYALSGSGSWSASLTPKKLHDEMFAQGMPRQAGSVALNGTIKKVE